MHVQCAFILSFFLSMFFLTKISLYLTERAESLNPSLNDGERAQACFSLSLSLCRFLSCFTNASAEIKFTMASTLACGRCPRAKDRSEGKKEREEEEESAIRSRKGEQILDIMFITHLEYTCCFCAASHWRTLDILRPLSPSLSVATRAL